MKNTNVMNLSISKELIAQLSSYGMTVLGLPLALTKNCVPTLIPWCITTVVISKVTTRKGAWPSPYYTPTL